MSIITTYNSLQGQLSFNDNILENSLNSAGFFKNLRQNIFNKFNIFGFYDTEGRLGKTFEYVFFTKPDLFIDCSSLANCIEFQSARQTNPEVINELCLSRGSYKPFSALLYNYRKSNLELPDLEAFQNRKRYGSMHDYAFEARSVWWLQDGFKTVNGMEACTTTAYSASEALKDEKESFKTVNGMEACTTTHRQ